MELVLTEQDLINLPTELLVLAPVSVGDVTELIVGADRYTEQTDIIGQLISQLPVMYYQGITRKTGGREVNEQCFDFITAISEIDPKLLQHYTTTTWTEDRWGLQTLDGKWITDAEQAVLYISDIQAELLDKTSATRWDKIKNIKEAAARVAAALKEKRKIKASSEIQEARMKICQACPAKIKAKLGDSCTRCGCYIKPKTLIAVESCPLRRWHAEEV